MKQQIFDKEIRLECFCGDPFEFVHFGLQLHKTDPWLNNKANAPDLFITFHSFFGSFKERLKKALHFIFSRQWEEEADVILTGRDNLEKLRDFCDECLKLE